MTPANEENVVVDTNVWVMAHKSHEDPPSADQECMDICGQWLTELRKSTQSLVVDNQHAILSEYWKYLEKGQHSATREVLGNLRRRGRIREIQIAFDENGKAILPPDFNPQHLNDEDWKFIAVALACNPHAPIVNATDTDWALDKDVLAEHDLRVEELCPGWIGQKISGRS